MREKKCSTPGVLEEARELLALLRPLGVPLIVNDRVDVALAIGADGVHLGQQDMAIAEARRLGPPSWIIGISAESVADAIRAEREGADYIGVSPVFATPTKTDHAPPVGLDGVRAIRAAVKTSAGGDRRHPSRQRAGGDPRGGGRLGGGVGHRVRRFPSRSRRGIASRNGIGEDSRGLEFIEFANTILWSLQTP